MSICLVAGCLDGDDRVENTSTDRDGLRPARVLPPDRTVQGKSRASWEAAFNQWINSIPLEQNPAMDPALSCDVNQSGPVFFTVSSATSCQVPDDKYVFLPIGGAADTYPCADPDIAAAMGEPAPGQSLEDFLLADVTGLTSAFFDFSDYELRIDGRLVSVEPYHTSSPLFTFTGHPSLAVPDFDPCLTPGATQFGLFDGWVMLIEPMSEGTHTVRKINHLTGSDRTITFHVVDDDDDDDDD